MKIFVWGMGIKFSLLRDRVIKINEIEGFIDNNGVEKYLDKPVYKPEVIAKMEYDAIIVANNSADGIYTQCKEVGIDIKKVVFMYKNGKVSFLNNNYDLTKKIFGEEYANYLEKKYAIINAPTIDEVNWKGVDSYYSDSLFQDDYVRVRTMLMVADEIESKKLEGAVAEFGVFRGDFAKNINRAFQNRKLYLFDTFEGFAEDEALAETEQDTCNNTYVDAFKNTSIERVKNVMPYLEQVDIRQGYFPQSAENINEKFVFVSIDVDFEESTYNGLNFFYPRLCEGGYIFIHDYNYGFFDKVKKAVIRYESDNNIHIKKVPLCDYNGTIVIIK